MTSSPKRSTWASDPRLGIGHRIEAEISDVGAASPDESGDRGAIRDDRPDLRVSSEVASSAPPSTQDLEPVALGNAGDRARSGQHHGRPRKHHHLGTRLLPRDLRFGMRHGTGCDDHLAGVEDSGPRRETSGCIDDDADRLPVNVRSHAQ